MTDSLDIPDDAPDRDADRDVNDDSNTDLIGDLQAAWQQETVPALTREDEMQLVADLKRAQTLQSRLYRRRDIGEAVACLFNVLWFGLWMLEAESQLERWGTAIVVSGSIFIFYVLRFGRQPFNRSEEATSIAESYRLHLVGERRQQRLLRWVPLWYLGPIYLGLVLIVAGMFGLPGLSNDREKMSLLMIGSFTLLFAGIAWLNRRAASKTIPEKIDDLERLAEKFGDDAFRS